MNCLFSRLPSGCLGLWEWIRCPHPRLSSHVTFINRDIWVFLLPLLPPRSWLFALVKVTDATQQRWVVAKVDPYLQHVNRGCEFREHGRREEAAAVRGILICTGVTGERTVTFLAAPFPHYSSSHSFHSSHLFSYLRWLRKNGASLKEQRRVTSPLEGHRSIW